MAGHGNRSGKKSSGKQNARNGLGLGETMGDMSKPVGSAGRGMTADEANGMLTALRALAAARGIGG